MIRYSIEPRTRKYVKGYIFLRFVRNLSNKYGKQLFDTATKIGINALKNVPKKVIYKAGEGTGEFIGNKIADKIVKTEANSKNVEEIIVRPEKRKEILTELRQIL